MKKIVLLFAVVAAVSAPSTLSGQKSPVRAPVIPPTPTEAFAEPTPKVAILADKGLAEDLRKIAELQAKNRMYDEAINAYTAILRLKATDVDALVLRSASLSAIEKEDLALNDLNEALSIEPSNTKVLRGLGRYYIGTKDYNEAIELYTRAISISPKEEDSYRWRAVANFLKNVNSDAYKVNSDAYKADVQQYAKLAVENNSEVLAKEPRNLDALRNRASGYSEANNHQKAIEDLSRIVEMDPTDSDAYLSLGRAYFGAGNKKMAERAFKENYDLEISKATTLILANPKNPRLFFGRGQIYFNHEAYEKAIEDFNRALSLDPERYDAYVYRAFAKLHLRSRVIRSTPRTRIQSLPQRN